MNCGKTGSKIPSKAEFQHQASWSACTWISRPWRHWRCLNRLRTRVVRTRSTLAKWGLLNGPTQCRCGFMEDTAPHLLRCPLFTQKCWQAVLLLYNDTAEINCGILEGLCPETRSSWSERIRFIYYFLNREAWTFIWDVRQLKLCIAAGLFRSEVSKSGLSLETHYCESRFRRA